MRRIGDVIVQLGFAERGVVERVVEEGRARGIPLGQSLIDAGLVDSKQLAQALAERNGLHYVDLNVFDVDKGAAALIDAAKAKRYRTVPIAFLGEGALLVATADPANLLALDDITMATGYEVRRAVASLEDIEALIAGLSTLEESVQEDSRRDRGRGGAGHRAARVRRRCPGRQARPLGRSPTPCGAAPPTSTSSRAQPICACASASTAWCSTRPPCRATSCPGSCRASRSWPSSTSPRSACHRTAASACRWTATTWTCASRRCRSCAASRS